MRTNTTAHDPLDTVRINFVVTASSGGTDYRDSTCSVVINRPAGAPIIHTSASTASTGLIHDSIGHYHVDVVPTSTEFGRWSYQFTATGPVYQSDGGAFAVRPLRASS